MSDTTFDFTSRRAFVTGAGGGIGHQIACELADAGCTVTGFDIQAKPEPFPPAQGEVRYVHGDVCDAGAVAHAVAEAARDGLDFVVNGAGVAFMTRDGSVVDVDMDVWERTLQVNLQGPVNVVRSAVPHMLRAAKGGAFVHIASVAGARSMDNVLNAGPLDAYQVSKAALISLSNGLALTYGRDGIRSNTICPGAIRTPMTDAIYEDPDRISAMENRTPLPRLGRPQDIAAACLFLLSNNASFITGIDMMVDGGLTAKLC